MLKLVYSIENCFLFNCILVNKKKVGFLFININYMFMKVGGYKIRMFCGL